MKKLLFLLVGAVLVAAAALGARQSGVEFAALMERARSMIPGQTAQQASVPPQAQAQGQPQGQRPNRGPSPVETARAATSQLSDDISGIGTLLAEESVDIAPETSGRVAQILFQDGAAVTEGMPLFQFDTELAEADLSEARSRLELAEANFTRNQTLRRSGNVAQTTFDAARTERDVARSLVASAEVRLAKFRIAAPFAGTLGFRAVSEGAYVSAGTALVKLDKIDRLKVGFAVPELQQSRVRPGQSVELTADALPDESFVATISALDPSIDVNGRSLQVRADLDNATLKLRPGLLVRVLVKGPERQSVTVPEAAIVQRGEDAFVFTVAENKAKEVKVRLGKRLPGKVEILDGLAAGETVVTAGGTRLSNGAAVEVISAAAAAE